MDKNKKIENLFDIAREQKPVLSKNEARDLIEQKASGTLNHSPKKLRIKPMILYSGLTAIIAAGLITFGVLVQNDDNINSANNPTNTSKNADNLNKERKTNSIDPDFDNYITNNNDAPATNDYQADAQDIAYAEAESKPETEKQTKVLLRKVEPLPVKGANIIQMTPEELSRFGITVNEDDESIKFTAFGNSSMPKEITLYHNKKCIFGQPDKEKENTALYPKFVSDVNGNKILSLFGDGNNQYMKFENVVERKEEKKILLNEEKQLTDKIQSKIEELNPKVEKIIFKQRESQDHPDMVWFIHDYDQFNKNYKNHEEYSELVKKEDLSFNDIPQKIKNQFARYRYIGVAEEFNKDGSSYSEWYVIKESEKEKYDAFKKEIEPIALELETLKEKNTVLKYRDRTSYTSDDKNFSININESKLDTVHFNDFTPDDQKVIIENGIGISNHKINIDSTISTYYDVIMQPGEDSADVKKDIHNRYFTKQVVVSKRGSGEEQPENNSPDPFKDILSDVKSKIIKKMKSNPDITQEELDKALQQVEKSLGSLKLSDGNANTLTLDKLPENTQFSLEIKTMNDTLNVTEMKKLQKEKYETVIELDARELMKDPLLENINLNSHISRKNPETMTDSVKRFSTTLWIQDTVDNKEIDKKVYVVINNINTTDEMESAEFIQNALNAIHKNLDTQDINIETEIESALVQNIETEIFQNLDLSKKLQSLDKDQIPRKFKINDSTYIVFSENKDNPKSKIRINEFQQLNRNDIPKDLPFDIDSLIKENGWASLLKSNSEFVLNDMQTLREKFGIINKADLTMINRLIPVAVNTTNHKPMFILWFDPSDELLDKLPQQAGTMIKKEIDAAESTDDVCETSAAITGEDTYFDIWHSCSGDLKELAVYPNPASDAATVRFHLDQARVVNIKVHDMQGRNVLELANNISLSAGDHEQPVMLQNLNPGMYYIVLETDRGEQVFQRLIIEK